MNENISKVTKYIKRFAVYIIVTLIVLSATGNIKAINLDKNSPDGLITFKNLKSDYEGKINGLVSTPIKAKRGTIYDSKGRIIAYDAPVYDIYFVVGAKDSKGQLSTTENIKNVQQMSKDIATIINVNAADLETKLTSVNEGIYQVEIGKEGKNLTPEQKDKISALKYQGVGFTEKNIRKYPNNNFASHIIGYAKEKEVTDENNVTKLETHGELGLEQQYDEILTGVDGSITATYINNKIAPGTAENVVEAKNGKDIYLTIDMELQLITEQVMNELQNEQNPDWAQAIIMNPNTGEIVAATSSPTFNLNTRNDIKNYTTPLYSSPYEPGSTFKTFTWAAAIENNSYQGDKRYQTGSIQVDDTQIKDHNEGKGWGIISYDQGFKVSSNTGAVGLTQSSLGYDKLKSKIDDLKFGKPLNEQFTNQASGSIQYNVNVEKANVTFGQGILVNGFQMMRASSAVYNNSGRLVEPRIVRQIGENATSTVQSEEVVFSAGTRAKIKDLARVTVEDDSDGFAFGKDYKTEGYTVYGKTGTGQQIDQATKKYDFSSKNFVYSFLGYIPNEKQDLVFYIAVKGPKAGYSHAVQGKYYQRITKSVLTNVGVNDQKNGSAGKNEVFNIDSYINQDAQKAKADLEKLGSNYEIQGSGNQIIAQYPEKGQTVSKGEKVVLIASSDKLVAPNFAGMEIKQINSLCLQLNIKCSTEGEGFAYEQSIQSNYEINQESDIINIKLRNEG
jgi:penicillin-binding protein 2B